MVSLVAVCCCWLVVVCLLFAAVVVIIFVVVVAVAVAASCSLCVGVLGLMCWFVRCWVCGLVGLRCWWFAGLVLLLFLVVSVFFR